jgi:hypothetical protein
MEYYHHPLPSVLLGIGVQAQLGQPGAEFLFSVVAMHVVIAGFQGNSLSMVAVFLSGYPIVVG